MEISTEHMELDAIFEILKKSTGVTTDSRNCCAGNLFVALKGDAFDGNKFAAAALEAGCSHAIIDEAEYALDDRYILVDDALDTYQQLARLYREQFDLRVVGITGTNGKTTTKELVTAVLSEQYKVLSTQGNFNNDVGVPKTLFALDASHDIAIVEMGASHPGDIKRLVEIVEPQYGLITNVGRAHLQGFGSFEGVKHTKGELYDYLRSQPGTTVFVNGGDRDLMGMAKGINMVTYGLEGPQGMLVAGRIIECSPKLSFEWESAGESHRVDTQLVGSYNIYNMLAAVCVGLSFGVDAQKICHALSSYVPRNNRSQLDDTGRNTLLADAYNANPTSMAAAIANFALIKADHKMAILGDMKELGADSQAEHQRVVDQLTDAGIESIWLVGDEFGHIPCPYRKFHDVEEVKAAIGSETITGRFILIKGSNSTRLSQLVEVLK